MLARLQAEDGNRIGAATVYENYLAVFPDDSAARDRAASLLLEEGRYDQASILVADRPVTEKGRLVSACQMIRGSNWQEAEAILRDIIISNPLDPMVIIQLSRCLAARRAFAEARALLDKGRKANPGYPALENEVNAVEFAYATHLSETGDLKEALAYYRRLVKLEPDNPRYLLNLGHAEMMNGEFSLAISHFRKGLKLTPGEDWARSGLAYSLMREWDFDGAIREMKLLLAKGDDPDYLLQLGSMYNQIGNTREGWALIRKAARLGHPEAARLVRERYGDQP